MKKYIIDVTYSLAGNEYTEVNYHLPCVHKAYDSMEEAKRDLENDIELGYNNKNYRCLQVHFSKIKDNYFWHGWFECAYIFGPHVRYDCRIKEVTF